MGLIKHSTADIRALQKTFDKQYFTDSDGYLVERTRNMRNSTVVTHRSAPTPRGIRKQAGSRSSAASGDGNGNGDSDPDPDPERHFRLLNQDSLADILSVSKKTLQNLFSSKPHLLPKAIQIPCARGPRWTQTAVQAWLDSRPAYTTTPVQTPTRRKVGRPRIAPAVKWGAK